MRRIGVFGGTFNPPHAGHIQAAEQALRRLKLNEVKLVPAYQVPGKAMPPSSPSPAQRLELTRLACRGHAGLVCDDTEIARGEPCYTCDTVRVLQAREPDAKLVLLVGTDMLACLPAWKNAADLVRMAEIAVLLRGEPREREKLSDSIAAVEALGGRVTAVENTPCPISSTQLRRLLAFGCTEEFLEPEVTAYILNNGLYHTRENWKHLPMERLEPIVKELLNPNRVNHVLGCRDTAVRLAKRWGADPTDAARAGILHDVTKALDGPLQLTLCRSYATVLDEFSRAYPKTLHALTGSLVAERIFGENEAVVSAIRRHTTGEADMNLLDTILYVADYMEPNRDFPGVEKLRELADTDITAALKLGLEMTLEHLREQGSEVSPASRQALQWLKEKENTLC